MTSEFYNIPLDCIDRHANSNTHKDKTALLFVTEDDDQKKFLSTSFSFHELKKQTNRFASALQSITSDQQERLIIWLPNSPEFPIVFLGAIKARMIPIPTSPLFTFKELKFILEDSEASVLVTTEELWPPEISLENFPFLKKIIVVQDNIIPREKKNFDRHLRDSYLRKNDSRVHRNEKIVFWNEFASGSSDVEVQPTLANSPAYWLYTSGTEGKPKGVIHSHQSIPAHDSRVKYWQNLQKDEMVFNTSSLNWSYALTAGMLDIWRHGETSLIYQGNLNAQKLAKIVKDFKVTLFMSVPTLYRRLAEFLKPNDDCFKKVRVCLSAGEKLPQAVKEDFKKATALSIREGLGMTEHSIYLIQRYDEVTVDGSCGKPIPDEEIKILKQDLTETKTGEIGEIASRRSSPGLMLGYYHRPDEEKQVFKNDWFLSGDFAYRDNENNFFFVGRKDDLITAGGFRISPFEVEAVLSANSMILEAAVIGREIEPGKTIVVAFVVLKSEYLSTQRICQKILEEASKGLAKYKVPREIIFIKELPKTSQGKLKRKELSKFF